MFTFANFLKCVVGIVNYKKLLGQGCKLSEEVATPSDEALTLLLFENSIHRWTREYEVREHEKGDQYQIKGDELLTLHAEIIWKHDYIQ
jgi:hypothetical protein